MNILLLGNGFDLHHKFPTTYMDFLHTVKFLVDYYNEETMKSVADVFGDERLKNNRGNILNSYSEYEDFYKETLLDSSKVKSIIAKAKKNLWFDYFSNSVKKELTWIDFEKEISEVVKAFREFFVDKKISFNLDLRVKDIKTRYIFCKFAFFMELAPNSKSNGIPGYIVKHEYQKENPIGSEIYEINKDKVVSELYSSLRELTDILKAYLKLFIDGVIIKIEENGFTFKNDSYPDLSYVFSFNYTNTVEKLYTTEDIVFHIHGNVDENIVLGVNPDKYDELEDLDTSFIKFKKYFQRVFYRTDIGYMKAIDEINRNLKSAPSYAKNLTVYVIGHSLDETDKDVIQEIFNFANKIKIFYHKDDAVGDYIMKLVNIYGKEGFDSLRTTKGLEFVLHEASKLYHS